jgi:hypothetical protein
MITGVRLACVVLVAIGSPLALAQDTSLDMTSEPGDYIGQGQDWHYTTADATFTAVQSGSGNVVHVHLATSDPSWGWWDLDFAAPQGQPLAVGEYTGATRWPFNEPDVPGLSVSGMGRGCNMLYGFFNVMEIAIAADGTVDSFWATFVQHCESPDAPALIGEIRFQAGGVATATLSWSDLKAAFSQ